MEKTKDFFLTIQYYVVFSALPFYFIGYVIGYFYMNNKDIINVSLGKYGFWFPYLFFIILISYVWNTLLVDLNVLGHLYYLNGVDNVYSKAYKAQNNITA